MTIKSAFSTILGQLDHCSDPLTGGLVPSIHFGVTSQSIVPPDGIDDMAGEYARSGNATAALGEAVIAKLEGAEACALFNAGSAAAMAVLSTLHPGDHLVLEADGYYEFRGVISSFCERWGLDLSLVDLSDIGALRTALRPGRTRLVWAEAPTNPFWTMPDLVAVAGAAHAAGARLLVDATVATPILMRSLHLGADVVLHSATKYLNGHGDLTAGVLAVKARNGWWTELMSFRTSGGTILPPFESWLLMRGLRTLELRVTRAAETALRIAQWLSEAPGVSRVYYPGLPRHESHDKARAQMHGGFGAMLSFRVAGGGQSALNVCGRTRVIRRSTSLGSTETMIEHRRSTEGVGSRSPDDLLRLSVGIEAYDDLIDDLSQALRGASMG